MSSKINGIKHVDIRITAEGYGVVNWNGPTAVANKDASNGKSVKDLNNHSMPKLRGYTNLTGRVSEGGFPFKKTALEVDFDKTPMYVSSNCIRHHLFRDHAFDAHYIKKDTQENTIASSVGLLRGYVIPSTGASRTSPLFLTDFVDQLGNGNYEQMGRFGSKSGEDSANSIFSKTTFGDTLYVAHGSISIEEISFISLDDKFGRAALVGVKESQVPKIIESISDHIKTLAPDTVFSTPLATYHANYVRKGTIFNQGEAGILLSQEAVHVLVQYLINEISELSIKQAKGYLVVTDVQVDYNDSHQMLRIKHKPDQAKSDKHGDYAVYFNAA